MKFLLSDFRVYLFTLSILSLVFTCSLPENNFANPETLILGAAVTSDYEKTLAKLDAYRDFLEETLGMPVKIYKVTNGTAIIEAMKAEKIHVGSAGAFSYIVGRSSANIRPLVRTEAVSEDTLHHYWSSLVVPPDSKINNMEDLIRERGNLTLAWAYPTSTSGHLVPRSFFYDRGVMPEDFKAVMVSENHISSLYSAITGKVDVAAVASMTFDQYIKRGKIKPEDYKIIWNSDPIPRSALFVSNKLDKTIAQKIKDAFTKMHETDLDITRKINYIYDYDVKYVPVDDSYYDGLREMAYKTGILERESKVVD